MLQLHGGEAEARTRPHLAALHGEIGLAAGAIARHDLELRAQQHIHDIGVEKPVGADARRARDDFTGHHVLDGLRARRMPGHGEQVAEARRSHPVELAHVEAHGGAGDQLLQRNAVVHHAQIGPIARRLGEHILGGAHMARAGHVAHDDGGRAGDEARHVLGEHARRGVEDAARPGADDDVDGLAGVEILNGVGVGGAGRQQQGGGEQAAARNCQHGVLPDHHAFRSFAVTRSSTNRSSRRSTSRSLAKNRVASSDRHSCDTTLWPGMVMTSWAAQS